MPRDDSELFSISDQPEDASFVPMYNVSHVMDIEDNDSSENDSKPKRSKSGKNCWNCGDTGHSLRECPSPLDPRQINKNRASFNNRNEFKRYHVDNKEEAFNHLKPGVFSDQLRKALGIRNDQLPMFVYRMRSLGYPPGWLLEAKVDHSGIEMFDVDGNRIPNADEEEGEIGSTITLYDESKIITFPGFNEWPPPGTLDETREYNAPDLRNLPSKEEFIKSLKHLSKPPLVNFNSKPEPINPYECDMETEEIEGDVILPEDSKCAFIPPLPDDSDKPPPPPPEGSPDDSVMDEGNKSEKMPMNENKSNTEDESDVNSEFADASHGRVKSIELGTPALKIHSPFQRLPPPEAFRKDISDVINFENLPDSTGAYEKLKDVLKNVRSKLSSLKDNKLNNTI